MPLFLTTLLDGGPSYTVEPTEPGIQLVRKEGHEEEFNEVARRVIEKAGPRFVAFPRPDGFGGYDCVHIIPHE
jgi:hypothetical protein